MRYISADAFIEYANKNLDICASDLIYMINEQPTAEVVEVVHGEWIPTGGETLFLREFRCNRCKSRQLGNTNYCPNCGAKMDGKKVE